MALTESYPAADESRPSAWAPEVRLLDRGDPGLIDAHFRALARAAQEALAHSATIRAWGQELALRFEAGGRLLACGNGGSASEAQHLTGELLGRFRYDRRALPAIALCADMSATTAILNDYGGTEVFARQVRAHGQPGDVLVAFSTSGTSANIVAAAEAAREVGVTTWALTGKGPNPLSAIADATIPVQADSVATVQEIHLSLVHALCVALDEALGIPV